jgi:hypothetical protein
MAVASFAGGIAGRMEVLRIHSFALQKKMTLLRLNSLRRWDLEKSHLLGRPSISERYGLLRNIFAAALMNLVQYQSR